jgi:hypothetical protein
LPFNSPKVEHVLAIGDLFQELLSSGRLKYFAYEPKDEFNVGRKMTYAPDAFFALDRGGSYLLELQRSNLSTNRWALKWAIASAFFDGNFYKSASWQVAGKIILKPKILVITKQSQEVVRAGSSLPLLIQDTMNFFQ